MLSLEGIERSATLSDSSGSRDVAYPLRNCFQLEDGHRSELSQAFELRLGHHDVDRTSCVRPIEPVPEK